MTQYTTTEESEIRRMWAEGLTTAEIGRRLNRSLGQVIGKAHRMGLPKRASPVKQPVDPTSPWTPERREMLRTLYPDLPTDDVKRRMAELPGPAVPSVARITDFATSTLRLRKSPAYLAARRLATPPRREIVAVTEPKKKVTHTPYSWPPEALDLLRECQAARMRHRDIATRINATFGVSVSELAVRHKINKLKLSAPVVEWTQAEDDLIYEGRQQGLKYREIRDRLSELTGLQYTLEQVEGRAHRRGLMKSFTVDPMLDEPPPLPVDRYDLRPRGSFPVPPGGFSMLRGAGR